MEIRYFIFKKKIQNYNLLSDGGWHFTNIKSPEDLEKKFKFFIIMNMKKADLKINDIKKNYR